jgi:hypothetical protein
VPPKLVPPKPVPQNLCPKTCAPKTCAPKQASARTSAQTHSTATGQTHRSCSKRGAEGRQTAMPSLGMHVAAPRRASLSGPKQTGQRGPPWGQPGAAWARKTKTKRQLLLPPASLPLNTLARAPPQLSLNCAAPSRTVKPARTDTRAPVHHRNVAQDKGEGNDRRAEGGDAGEGEAGEGPPYVAVPAVRTNNLAREQVLVNRDTVSPQESEGRSKTPRSTSEFLTSCVYR